MKRVRRNERPRSTSAATIARCKPVVPDVVVARHDEQRARVGLDDPDQVLHQAVVGPARFFVVQDIAGPYHR